MVVAMLLEGCSYVGCCRVLAFNFGADDRTSNFAVLHVPGETCLFVSEHNLVANGIIC